MDLSLCWESSSPASCSLPSHCAFPIVVDSFARAWETGFHFALIPGAETHKHQGKKSEPQPGNPEGVRSGMAGITQEPHCQMKSYTEIRTREFENTSYPLRAVLGLPAPHVLPQLCCLPSSSMVSFSSQPCPCRFFISGLMSPAPKASQRLPKGLHSHQGGNPSLSGRQEPLRHH